MTKTIQSSERTDLQSFFTTYGEALAAGELEAVADAYGYPSLVVGEAAGVNVAVPDRDAVIGAFTGAAEGYRARGLTKALPEILAAEEVNPAIVAADVRWSYADDPGEVHERSAYRYLLRRLDDGYVIQALIEMPAR